MPPDTIPSVYLLGRFDPAQDSLFVRIEDAYSGGSARGAYMHREAYAAFVDMHAAARRDGVVLTILSATRNFDRQQAIWEEKWTGRRLVGGQDLARTIADPAERARTILRYSSMPGTSRHHWGSDIDLNAFENSYFATGKGLREYTWLQTHAAAYGFGQPYTAKGPHRPDGYEEEKWHWSYLPVARRYLAAYQAQIDPAAIRGFAGAETARDIDVIGKYVLGIDPVCK
ncbi:MAG: M15 family metallopeptidase [Bacteroidia bacterium]